MGPVAQFLLALASILVIGSLGEVIFRRTNVPDVIWLIAAGVVLGPVLHVVTREQLSTIAPFFGPLTLVFVLFEGGSKLRLTDVRQSAPRSGLLAVLTFTLATAAVAGSVMLARTLGAVPADWSFSHAILVGTILGGSSSIIVMPAMTQARVPDAASNLVGLESAFTDAFCVVGATTLINVLHASHVQMDLTATTGAADAAALAPPSSPSPLLSLARSFGIGAALGLAGGGLWLLAVRSLKKSPHTYPLTLAALLVLYVAVDKLQGSAALGVLTFAIVLGNARSITAPLTKGMGFQLEEHVRGFHEQLTFVIKSLFFTFIGAMLGPPWGAIGLGVVLGLVLLVARLPGVLIGTLGSGMSRTERRITLVALPRGMAAGVLATMPAAAGLDTMSGLPPIVFAAVLTSILVFAAGFPLAKR